MEYKDILAKGYALRCALERHAERLGIDWRKLSIKLVVPVSAVRAIHGSPEHMRFYDWRDGETPPLFGMPVEIGNADKEIRLWVEIK